MLSTL
jgi:hypothetical protein